MWGSPAEPGDAAAAVETVAMAALLIPDAVGLRLWQAGQPVAGGALIAAAVLPAAWVFYRRVIR